MRIRVATGDHEGKAPDEFKPFFQMAQASVKPYADAGKLMRLIDALEELDDVAAVNANFDIEARVLERIAS